MATATDPQQTPAERLIARTIGATWLLYAVGGLYIAGPALGWTLAGMACWRLYAGPALAPELRAPPLGGIVWVWILAMAAMLLALWFGHAANDLSAGQTIKSSIGWAKGWALLAVFPFGAAVLDVRPEIVYRAVCRLGRQTLILIPFFLIAPLAHLPELLYVSPLKVLGGSSDEFFTVMLYTIEPGVGTARWQFFAPWSPAAGMVAVVYILCAIEERDRRWKIVGIVAGVLIALLSASRLALVAIAVVWPLAHIVARLSRPATWWIAAPGVLATGLFAPAVLKFVTQAQADFSGARADSSRVRAALGRIAVTRWRTEAPWFGHGIVERGPHMVEYMPIGSHHSWYGLLFVKGAMGAVALGVPLAYSLIVTGRLALRDPIGRVGLSMLIVLFLYSFGENLEVLGYLFWPALVLIGAAARRGSERRHEA